MRNILRNLSITKQTVIAAILLDMDTDLLVLEASRDKTHGFAMMQELLTRRTQL